MLLDKKGFEQSTIVNSSGELQVSDYRKSYTSYLTTDGLPEKYNPPLENLIKRICYIGGCKRDQIEGLMMVKYEESDEGYYWDHHDYFQEKDLYKLDNMGNRLSTFFVYLNTLEKDEGGETYFPRIDIASRPRRGDAVFWWNIRDGKVIPETEHRGNPVKRTKYGLNIWIREYGIDKD